MFHTWFVRDITGKPKIAHLWLLRQLTPDEANKRVRCAFQQVYTWRHCAFRCHVDAQVAGCAVHLVDEVAT